MNTVPKMYIMYILIIILRQNNTYNEIKCTKRIENKMRTEKLKRQVEEIMDHASSYTDNGLVFRIIRRSMVNEKCLRTANAVELGLFILIFVR